MIVANIIIYTISFLLVLYGVYKILRPSAPTKPEILNGMVVLDKSKELQRMNEINKKLDAYQKKEKEYEELKKKYNVTNINDKRDNKGK